MRKLGGVAALLALAATAMGAPFAYFAGDTQVTVVDTATDTVVDDVPLVNGSFGIAVARDGRRVYVHGFDDVVDVIDATTNATLPPLPLPDGAGGTLAVHPLGTAVYVNNNAALVVKDPADPAAETVVPLTAGGDGPFGVRVRPDGAQVYVSMFNLAEIRVLDTATNALLPSIPVGEIRGSLMGFSPDGARLYVPHRDAGSISIVDTAANAVVDTIPSVGNELNAVVVHPDGTRLYATRATGAPHVVEIDLASKTTTATIPTPAGAFNLDILPDGSKLYVTDFSNVVTVVATSTRTTATLPLPEGVTAFGPFIAPQRCGDGILTFPEACDDGNTADGDCCAGDCSAAAPDTTPCSDDGDACTADRCDGAGACAHPVQAGATCDDGDVCTVADACDPDGLCTGTASGACIDDFLCYAATRTKGSPRGAAVRGIALTDAFASRTADAKPPGMLCAPVAEDTAVDPATHLGGWRLARPSGARGPKGIVVDDRVATTTLDVQRPVLLLVPSGVATQGTPSAPDAAVHLLDPLTCHAVKPTRGATKPPRGLTRTVTGGLTGVPRTLALKKPRLLCAATAVGDAAPRFPGRDLVCWQVKAARGQAKPPAVRGVGVASGLGTATLDVGAEQLLCLRAARR